MVGAEEYEALNSCLCIPIAYMHGVLKILVIANKVIEDHKFSPTLATLPISDDYLEKHRLPLLIPENIKTISAVVYNYLLIHNKETKLSAAIEKASSGIDTLSINMQKAIDAISNNKATAAIRSILMFYSDLLQVTTQAAAGISQAIVKDSATPVIRYCTLSTSVYKHMGLSKSKLNEAQSKITDKEEEKPESDNDAHPTSTNNTAEAKPKKKGFFGSLADKIKK
jgi:hypothetical protein